jgi:hypothetical protein
VTAIGLAIIVLGSVVSPGPRTVVRRDVAGRAEEGRLVHAHLEPVMRRQRHPGRQVGSQLRRVSCRRLGQVDQIFYLARGWLPFCEYLLQHRDEDLQIIELRPVQFRPQICLAQRHPHQQLGLTCRKAERIANARGRDPRSKSRNRPNVRVIPIPPLN